MKDFETKLKENARTFARLIYLYTLAEYLENKKEVAKVKQKKSK